MPLSPERVSPATTPYHLRASLPLPHLGFGHGTLTEEKRAQFWVSPKAAPVFDSPFISVIHRKEKTVNTRKIFALLLLAVLLVATLVARANALKLVVWASKNRLSSRKTKSENKKCKPAIPGTRVPLLKFSRSFHVKNGRCDFANHSPSSILPEGKISRYPGCTGGSTVTGATTS